jgi:hypothetical protein
MAKYLNSSSLAQLDEYRCKIFALREEAYAKSGIDLLDNDTLSALSIYKIVRHYDPDYNINFARNGEDGKSNGVLIEQKASRIEKKKRSGLYANAGFQFHAQGDIEYNRYIFATRDKGTLDLICIYDISLNENVALVQNYLLTLRAHWEQKNKELGKTQKRDVIVLPENILISGLKNIKIQILDGVKVVKA